jgi:hypothetical protein
MNVAAIIVHLLCRLRRHVARHLIVAAILHFFADSESLKAKLQEQLPWGI